MRQCTQALLGFRAWRHCVSAANSAGIRILGCSRKRKAIRARNIMPYSRRSPRLDHYGGLRRASHLVRRASQENGLQEKQSQDFASLDAAIHHEQRIPTAVRTTPERSSLTAAKQQRRQLQESAPCPPQASLRCASDCALALVTRARRGGGSFGGISRVGHHGVRPHWSKSKTVDSEFAPAHTRSLPACL